MRSESLVKSAIGLTNYTGVIYQTDVNNLTGLIQPGSTGINHGAWAEMVFPLGFIIILLLNHAIGVPTDGVIALLTVTVIP